uniref:Uncharacterized protein n=1 Tax=Arundo donax TaxID=35708 RepID=A0A0A9H7Q8_ARUDO
MEFFETTKKYSEESELQQVEVSHFLTLRQLQNELEPMRKV